MIPYFHTSEAILKNVEKEGLYFDLVKQLQKDFILANIDIDFPLNSTSKVLLSLLNEKIYFLIMEKFMEYLNLMYIIDVPEKSFKEIKEVDVVVVAKQVSFLILKREWQKVWYKAKYSS